MSQPGLAKATARGVALIAGATVAGKVVSGLGQLVLAAILLPEQFGLVALAFTVMSFSRAVEQLGLREILIREQDRFDRWVNSAMWLAGAIGVLGMLLTAAFSPVAALIFDEPAVIPLILILAPASPLLSLAQINEARLERDMRYKDVTTIQFGVFTTQMMLAIALALLGFGAFSFVIPRPVVSLGRLLYSWRLVRPPITARPQLHRWPTLLRNGLPVMGSAILAAGLENADYVVLGLIAPSAAVGFYYFAFMQSTQVMQVFTTSLMRVLVPSLSTLKDDPVRQARAYLRGVKLVGIAVAPLCVMQAALAGPALRLIFADKWVPAIELLQLLSLSAIFTAISWPIISLLMAQGRYTLRFLISGVGVVLFTGSVATGALIGDHQGGGATIGAAVAVLTYRSLYGPIQTWYVLKKNHVRFTEVLAVYSSALVNALVPVGAIWWISADALPALIDQQPWLDLVRCAVVAIGGPGAFALWLRLTQPGQWSELVERVLSALPDRLARYFPLFLR